MPQTKDALIRLKKLDELLSDQYHEYTMDDLTRGVNNLLEELDIDPVTRRCIEKDIKFIEGEHSQFLAEITRYPIMDRFNEKTLKPVRMIGLRYARPDFSIFQKELSQEEENLIKELFHVIGQFDGLPEFENLEGYRRAFSDREYDEPYVPAVSFNKNPLENKNLFGKLFTCITQKQVIELHYHVFNLPEEDRFVEVYPYLLKEYNKRWYLFCEAANDTGKILNFALDRLNSVKPLPSKKYKEFVGNWDEYFEDIIGVTNIDGKETLKILFWVSDNHNSKNYVLTKPLHDSQTYLRNDAKERVQYPQLQGGGFFTIECKENYELIRELCSYGKDLIVLSPENIKEKVYHRIEDMFSVYTELK